MTELSNEIFPKVIQCVLYYTNIENSEVQQTVESINEKLLNLVLRVMKQDLDLTPLLSRLKHNFKSSFVKTKEIVIGWYTEMFKSSSEEMFGFNSDILENIIETLNFQETSLVKKILELLCMMSRKEDKFLREIVERLLRIFLKTREKLNISSINEIISILCANIDPQKVFKEFALALRSEFDDLEF